MVTKVAESKEVQPGLRLDADLYRRIRVAAAENDVSIKAFITHILSQYFDQQKKTRAA